MKYCVSCGAPNPMRRTACYSCGGQLATRNQMQQMQQQAVAQRRQQEQEEFLTTMRGIVAGHIPAPICRMPASLRSERVVKSGWRGTSMGVSLPVPGLKGVRFRLGTTQGSLPNEKAIVDIDEGDMVVDAEGVTYSGLRKTVSAKWHRVVGVRAWTEPDQTLVFVLSVQGRASTVILAVRPRPQDLAVLALFDRYAGTDFVP